MTNAQKLTQKRRGLVWKSVDKAMHLPGLVALRGGGSTSREAIMFTKPVSRPEGAAHIREPTSVLLIDRHEKVHMVLGAQGVGGHGAGG
jgi:hypothetical protein